MKTKLWIASCALTAAAAGLFAQQENIIIRRTNGETGTMIAQGAVGAITLAGEPGATKLLTEDFFWSNAQPLLNAPYSADEKTESIQSLADGTRIVNTTTARVYRDSQGRTRREVTLPLVENEVAPRVMVTISDPVDGTTTSLDPQARIAHQNQNTSSKAMDLKLKAEMDAELAMLRKRANTEATTTATRSGDFQYKVITRGNSTPAQREDLGVLTVEGVRATGSRETNTIAVGAIGNDRPIVITSERWYSPELQIELKSVRNDPRMGQTTHTVSNLTRSEPDISLFKVPADYNLIQNKSMHLEVHP